MHKCNMWKPETDNQTLPPIEGQQKKYNIQSAIKALVKKDCEVEKKIKFLKEMEVFEEI